MSIWISLFISDFINMFVMYTMFKKLNNIEKKDIVSKLIVCLILSITCASLLSNLNSILNFFSKIILMIFLFQKATKVSLPKTLISVITIYITLIISEMLVGFVTLGILNIEVNTNSNIMSIFIFNIPIIIVCWLLFSYKKYRALAENIVNWYNEKYISNTIVVLFITLCPLYFFLIQNTKADMGSIDYAVNAIIITCLTIFVIYYLKQNEDKNKITKKYDHLLDYAKTYEQEVVEKSKWQHEYENQLIIVKDKISKRNKEARDYIDQLLKNKPVDTNSQWLGKLSKFPDIGIKGLLCYKIGQMQSNGISVFVDISENLKIKKAHKEVLEKNLQDISRILGVYIDNAADASCASKNKYFIFEFTCEDDKLIFQISNTFVGNIDLQKIGTERFSTKGQGHGYGLSLVRDILQNNRLLSEEREINGIYYVQRLIVDTKR